MRQLRYAPLAVADLRGIARYSRAHFGRSQTSQAKRYVRILEMACEALAADRRRGRAAEELSPDLLKLLVGWHLILSRVREDPEIVRILHGSMNHEDHL